MKINHIVTMLTSESVGDICRSKLLPYYLFLTCNFRIKSSFAFWEIKAIVTTHVFGAYYYYYTAHHDLLSSLRLPLDGGRVLLMCGQEVSVNEVSHQELLNNH